MRLLVVHPSDELYGADVVLLELLRRLPSSITPLVVLPTDLAYTGELARALDDAGIRYRRLDLAVLRRRYLTPLGIPLYLARLLGSILRLARLIHHEQIDVVHSNTLAVVGGALVARLTRRPHVWHVHEIITRPRSLARALAWLAPRLSERVVAVSKAVAGNLMDMSIEGTSWSRGFSRRFRRQESLMANDNTCLKARLQALPPLPSTLRVIPNGIDLSRYPPQLDGSVVRTELGLDPTHIVVGVVGRLSRWKGQDVFLDAAALVSRAVPAARFVIVGGTVPGDEGRAQTLADHAARLGLADRVVFTGVRRDIPQVMAALDILVLPSTDPEPFGLVLLEAMAAARPVIATAHGGPREIVVDGVSGVLVPPHDPANLAQAIMALAQSSDTRRAIGQAGRARVAQFTVERQVAQFVALYRELAPSPERV